jgi:serine/threonine protein kinase
MEAMLYLHTQIEIIHNDIKCNNILLADSPSIASSSSSQNGLTLQHHVVLIDFGKATDRTRGRHYNLSEIEMVTYLTRYPHIAPEVTHGEKPLSTSSDIYSLGKVLQRMADYGSLSRDNRSKLMVLGEKCCSIHYFKRPSAKQCLNSSC